MSEISQIICLSYENNIRANPAEYFPFMFLVNAVTSADITFLFFNALVLGIISCWCCNSNSAEEGLQWRPKFYKQLGLFWEPTFWQLSFNDV